MMFGRARLHRLTRDAGFLWRVCGGVIVAGIVLAGIMQALRPDVTRSRTGALLTRAGDWQRRMKSRAFELANPAQPQPAALADWLKELGRGMNMLAPGWKLDAAQKMIDDIRLDRLLQSNTVDETQHALFFDYTKALLLEKGEARDESVHSIGEMAGREPPVRFAGGFNGDLLLLEHKRKEALASYVREGRFEDARDARREAFSLAVGLGDLDTLRQLCTDPRYLREADSKTVATAARLTGQWWLMVRAVAKEQWHRWSHPLALPLALLAAGVWYFLLVYTGSSGRLPHHLLANHSSPDHPGSDPWRWIRFLPPVMAGVASVCLLHFWMETAPYGIHASEQETVTHEILQWVLYVGIPEESVKLALFSLFLPLLLRRRSVSRAALTAGCVGLGFAFDENLGYYLRDGGQTAIGRLITANFLHVAWTGIAGCALYELFRSRFQRAPEFLAAFLGVCAAHGLYDFASTPSAQLMGADFAGIIVVVIMARMYLDRLRPDDGALRHRTISATAVFCTGCALLIASTIIVTVWQTNSMRGATQALKSVVAVFPLALIYVREFREL